MVGRDIGTEVLPRAQVKLWVSASPEERARRRLAEHLSGADAVSEREMLHAIQVRDALDASRPISPLRRAPDAIVVETDRLTPAEALDTALAAVDAAVSRARASAGSLE
jgi:cytidylate kinase